VGYVVVVVVDVCVCVCEMWMCWMGFCREGDITMHKETPALKNPFLQDLDTLEVSIMGWMDGWMDGSLITLTSKHTHTHTHTHTRI